MKGLVTFFALITITQEKNTPGFYNERIVNGQNVKPGEIPYIVSLQNIGETNFCSGSILNKNYVVSAAHCFTRLRSDIKVIAGTTDLRNQNSTHTVVRIIMHENYTRRDSLRNDIALLEVKSAFVESSFVKFVKLPRPHQKITPATVAIVSGWGRKWKYGPASPALLKSPTLITSENYCKRLIKGTGLKIYKTQICAIVTNMRTGPCNGDSGGPLTVRGRIVGITSWAIGCGSVKYPAVYTRVSEYLGWIKKNTE
ncbi:hypothetical protein PV327_003522 [Microctonus hyperodae]|uniref:limulus clotting factor C n=1 Tax=Microctonus hyperodae TaxID=165561 RepID=A0AA39G534_MICHY|nr:hypothetical protein PV327_003522 [Microctonus hyperodae]